MCFFVFVCVTLKDQFRALIGLIVDSVIGGNKPASQILFFLFFFTALVFSKQRTKMWPWPWGQDEVNGSCQSKSCEVIVIKCI